MFQKCFLVSILILIFTFIFIFMISLIFISFTFTVTLSFPFSILSCSHFVAVVILALPAKRIMGKCFWFIRTNFSIGVSTKKQLPDSSVAYCNYILQKSQELTSHFGKKRYLLPRPSVYRCNMPK